MHVAVCISSILDPELPVGRLQVLDDGVSVREDGVPHFMSPFDEAALEVALKLCEGDPDTRLSVVAVGDPQADEVLRRALGLKAHEAVRVEAEAADMRDLALIASKLRAGLAALEPKLDLILIGRQYGDWDDGTVPPLLAESLGDPFLGLVHGIEVQDETVVAVRERADGIEKVALPKPSVVSVTNHTSNRIRMPLVKNVIQARRRELRLVTDGGSSLQQARGARAMSLEKVERRSEGRVLDGGTAEQAGTLAAILSEWLELAGR